MTFHSLHFAFLVLSLPLYICEKGKTTILIMKSIYINLIKQTAFPGCLVITLPFHILHFYPDVYFVL